MNKLEMLSEYGIDRKNTGCVSSQLIFLNYRLVKQIQHLQKNKKDIPNKRSMLKMLSLRKSLFAELKKKDFEKFSLLNSKLSLKTEKIVK